MVIDFLNQGPASYDCYEDLFNEYYVKIFAELALKGEYITDVTIVNNKTIHKINREFRNVDRPTDVISFALIDGDFYNSDVYLEDASFELGDVFICLDYAIKQANEYGHSVKREVAFLAVHGYLHLKGYDHQTKEDEEKMFSLQEKILQNAGVTR